jgi:large subunit ribosomal protein L22
MTEEKKTTKKPVVKKPAAKTVAKVAPKKAVTKAVARPASKEVSLPKSAIKAAAKTKGTRSMFASTEVNKSPRKTRLMINPIRGIDLKSAMAILKGMNKEKTKHIFNLLKAVASNSNIPEGDLANYKIKTITAEEAPTLTRIVPRARGSAFKIRRRIARVKVEIEAK